MHLEMLEQGREQPRATWDLLVRSRVALLNQQLGRADLVLCASDRQRSLYLGQLAALGRVSPTTYEDDPHLERLIAVAPFGLDDAPAAPHARRRSRRGRRRRRRLPDPAVGRRHLQLVRSPRSHSRGPLARRPRAAHDARVPRHQAPGRRAHGDREGRDPTRRRTSARSAARSSSTTTGSRTRSAAVSSPRPTPASRRITPTSRPSSRSARASSTTSGPGLPMVVTAGDAFADLVEAERLGIVVPAGDEDALEAALEKVLYDEAFARAARKRVAAVRERFLWERTLEPLRRIAREPRRAADVDAAGGRDALAASTRGLLEPTDRPGLGRDLAWRGTTSGTAAFARSPAGSRRGGPKGDDAARSRALARAPPGPPRSPDASRHSPVSRSSRSSPRSSSFRCWRAGGRGHVGRDRARPIGGGIRGAGGRPRLLDPCPADRRRSPPTQERRRLVATSLHARMPGLARRLRRRRRDLGGPGPPVRAAARRPPWPPR